MANTQEVFEKIRSEKIMRLKKYEEHLKTIMSGTVPDKHMVSDEKVKEYKAFLAREMARTKRSIASLGG